MRDGEREKRAHRLLNRNTRDQRESRRRRIAGKQPHQPAAVEVAVWRHPGPPAPTASAGLAVSADPRSFGGSRTGQPQHVVVGRNRFGNCLDQNSALAAAMLTAPNAGIAR